MKLSILAGINDSPLGTIFSQLQNMRRILANRSGLTAQIELRKINFAQQAIVNLPPSVAAPLVARIAVSQDVAPDGTLIMDDDDGLEGMNTYRGWKILKTNPFDTVTNKSWKATNRKVTAETIFSNNLSKLRNLIDSFWDKFSPEEEFDGVFQNSKKLFELMKESANNPSKFYAVKFKDKNNTYPIQWTQAMNTKEDCLNRLAYFGENSFMIKNGSLIMV